MAKKKAHKDGEELKGENRHLRKVIAHLKKQIGRADKELSKRLAEVPEERVEVQDDVEEIASELGKCPECKARLNSIDMGSRLIIHCTKCEYRRSKKV